jgi:hypothetical protein
MTQATDTDIRELKDLIIGLDRKMDAGFASIENKLTEIRGDIKLIDSRLVAVETTVTKLDNRLWTFIGLVLTITLGSLFTVLVRYLFWDNPRL